jgi:hypothetical protein
VPDTPSDAMLHRLMAEAQRALNALDPASRARIIAQFIQPYSGWALRWAIEDCRAHGMAWTTIADMVDRPYSTVLRQMRAGGPVYAHQPAHSAHTRNFDAQTPLRRAATELAQRMAALVTAYPGSTTSIHLRDRVAQLSTAQGVIDDPGPLLEATKVVVAAANGIEGQLPSREAMPTEERAVWNILEELDICYQRDHREIETAHQVMSRAGMLPRVSG